MRLGDLADLLELDPQRDLTVTQLKTLFADVEEEAEGIRREARWRRAKATAEEAIKAEAEAKAAAEAVAAAAEAAARAKVVAKGKRVTRHQLRQQ